MNEFANVLSEIIERGKQVGELTIKKIAQHSGITASYISNLKQGNQSPPSQKKLVQLTDALCSLGVADRDIQRLVSAYHRMQSGEQHDANILGSLIDEAQKDGGKLFERIARGIRIEEQEQQISPQRPAALDDEPLVEIVKGDRRASIVAAIRFIERALSAELEGRNIYLTWFQYRHDDELEPVREQLRTLLRQALREKSSTHLYHLWAGDAARDMSAIVTVLAHYLGTSNCFLYEVPQGQFIPEYFVVEGFGFVEARPASHDSWWIRTVIVRRDDLAQANELQAVNDYMEFLLGTKESRKPPLIQTEVSRNKFTFTIGEQNLADAEKQSSKGEQLLMQPSFSVRYRTCETLRLKFEALEFQADQIERYLQNHQERLEAFRELLAHGNVRMIHQQQYLSQQLRRLYIPDVVEQSPKMKALPLENALLKEQVIGILQTIKNHQNAHVALITNDLPIHCEIAGDTAFLTFETPTEQSQLSFERSQLERIAWTHHPDVVFQLRKEFDAKWKAIDELWRTDTETGKKNVVNFLIAESLKPLLKADVPMNELWEFMAKIVEIASNVDYETHRREMLACEQVAKHIILVTRTFPHILMPVGIGPWDAKSITRTRQRMLYAILREIEKFHLVCFQSKIEEYWETNQYDQRYTFKPEWTRQHFEHVHQVFTELPEKLAIEVIPELDRFPINFEIIDREFIFLGRHGRQENEGGFIFQNKELAEELLAYVERNLSAKCPEHLKGARNVAKWIEERFLTPRQS